MQAGTSFSARSSPNSQPPRRARRSTSVPRPTTPTRRSRSASPRSPAARSRCPKTHRSPTSLSSRMSFRSRSSRGCTQGPTASCSPRAGRAGAARTLRPWRWAFPPSPRTGLPPSCARERCGGSGRVCGALSQVARWQVRKHRVHDGGKLVSDPNHRLAPCAGGSLQRPPLGRPVGALLASWLALCVMGFNLHHSIPAEASRSQSRALPGQCDSLSCHGRART